MFYMITSVCGQVAAQRPPRRRPAGAEAQGPRRCGRLHYRIVVRLHCLHSLQ
jgi:hypothetical protein